MSAESKAFLIAALTGRMLAQSARRGGFPVVVLDLYNDLDTHRYARHSRAVAQHEQGFDAAALLKAADELCPPQRCAGLVCGSGFEDQPQLLKQLATGRPLYGNAAETVTRIKDPRQFFALLDELEMAHPEVRFAPPRPACGWLAKKNRRLRRNSCLAGRRQTAGWNALLPETRVRAQHVSDFSR